MNFHTFFKIAQSICSRLPRLITTARRRKISYNDVTMHTDLETLVLATVDMLLEGGFLRRNELGVFAPRGKRDPSVIEDLAAKAITPGAVRLLEGGGEGPIAGPQLLQSCIVCKELNVY